MQALVILLVGSAVYVAALPQSQHVSTRIVGGWEATITDYPQVASLISSYWGFFYDYRCAGIIINSRAALTVASCFDGRNDYWRIRVGSAYHSSGGTVHHTSTHAIPSNYNKYTQDANVAILKSKTNFQFSDRVQAATLASSWLSIGSNEIVRTAGWGYKTPGGSLSSSLRAVVVYTVDQVQCERRLSVAGKSVTDNMLCAGLLGIGGADTCTGDAGGPLLHGNVVVGITSWSSCGQSYYPGIYTKVSSVRSWIDQYS